MKAIVHDNQSLFDIAVQHCGAAEAAYDIAVINGLSITDSLTAGQVLEIPDPINKDIVKYFKAKGISPATSELDDSIKITAIKYGLLYNGPAVIDARNITATGWRVPTAADFEILANYLLENSMNALALVESGNAYWINSLQDGLNTLLFNARGSGVRADDGTFVNFKEIVKFRTTSQGFFGLSSYKIINYDAQFLSDFRQEGNKVGASVRLIKENTSLISGESFLYRGNDGKIYRTICIGNQEWLADNLAETQYREGESIPEITDNTAWSESNDGACCAFANDHNNI